MAHITRPIRTALAAAVALVFSACSDDDPASPPKLTPCTGTVTVSVSAGTSPTFTWTPACTVLALLVEEGASDRWFLEATGVDGIAPGVRYGTVPAGAAEDGPAIPLTAGRVYDVILFRGTVANPALAGTKEFTP